MAAGLPQTRQEQLKQKEMRPMTNQQAARTVEEIVRENRESGELEGILNSYRIAALNRLVHIVTSGVAVHTESALAASPKQKRKSPQFTPRA